jgi:hypothetical protein
MSLLLLALALQRDLPKEVREAFAKAESFELYSLDPGKRVTEDEGFHGWTILGKITLKDDAARSVREAVHAGAKDSDGRVAKCFIPRHGLRLGTMDLVICFECLQGYVYRGGEQVDSFLTTGAPAKILNKALTDAGVPLPAPPRK